MNRSEIEKAILAFFFFSFIMVLMFALFYVIGVKTSYQHSIDYANEVINESCTNHDYSFPYKTKPEGWYLPKTLDLYNATNETT